MSRALSICRLACQLRCWICLLCLGAGGLAHGQEQTYVVRRSDTLYGIARQFNVSPGTLAERLRAGGAGIPAFFTRTGVGTVVAENKETREFDGQSYVMERALKADVSLVKAKKADSSGNLVFSRTARNFNPEVAMAGTVTIAEVEEIVDLGQLDPDEVHLPGIFVDRIVVVPNPEKRIEKRTTQQNPKGA